MGELLAVTLSGGVWAQTISGLVEEGDARTMQSVFLCFDDASPEVIDVWMQGSLRDQRWTHSLKPAPTLS